MICLGYYEKLKSRYIGKTFLALGLRVEKMNGGLVTPAVGSEYSCKDVGLEMNKNGAVLILENESGEFEQNYSLAEDAIKVFGEEKVEIID